MKNKPKLLYIKISFNKRETPGHQYAARANTAEIHIDAHEQTTDRENVTVVDEE